MRIAKVLMVVLAVSLCCTAVNAQDDCATALAIPCNGSGVLDPANDATPTGPLAYCGSSGVNDVWATFVATEANARIRTCGDIGSVGTDSEFLMFAVDQADVCNQAGWVPYACQGDAGGACGYNNDISVGGLVVGDTYLIQMGHWNDAYSGSYTLEIDCPAPGGICGDGEISAAGDEECDGAATGSCLLTCEPDCTCTPVPTPMLPKWGLIGLALMLVVGGVGIFGRSRAVKA